MLRHKRNLVLDVFDYSGHKLCSLYDQTSDMNGQATNVIVASERNGWKELSFTIPSVCEGTDGKLEENFRIQFIKADFRIRLINGDYDDPETDWFIISGPKITHNKLAKTVNVKAGHVSQLLKTKNLGLEFSDEEGNNVGTAAQLLATILDGTGWEVGNVAEFKEKIDGKTKYRSLKAPAKTGAFKLITNMCDLFEAKPVFRFDYVEEDGKTVEKRYVDILPMNPFSEPEKGQLPDIADKDKVIELRYGNNLKNVTRTLNTENMVTKLYAYGAFGDKTTGYCGIDEWTHNEYLFSASSGNTITAGTECYFDFTNPATNIRYKRYFVTTDNVTSADCLTWSMLDPASMSYIWNESTSHAYPVYEERKTDNPTHVVWFQVAVDDQQTPVPENVDVPSVRNVQNWFSFLMDFDYYREVDLLTDEMVQTIADYQRNAPVLMRAVSDAAAVFNQALDDVATTVGQNNYCRLSISAVDLDEGDRVHLTLNYRKDEDEPESEENGYDKGVIYRTDYTAKPKKQFKWHTADKLREDGDPLNGAASIVYIIHGVDDDTGLVTFDAGYIREIVYEEGDEDEQKPQELYLWLDGVNDGGSITTDGHKIDIDHDRFFLFESQTINGLLGAYQVGLESLMNSLATTTKTVTVKHPVYFSKERPDVTIDEINGYAWWWKFYDDKTPSEMYFWYKESDDSEYAEKIVQGDTDWHRCWFGSTQPSVSPNNGDYFFNWKTATLYHTTDGNAWDALRDRSTSEDRMIAKFGTIFHSCQKRDQIYNGLYQYYTTLLDDELPAGNYAFKDEYENYYAFTTEEAITDYENRRLVYDSTNGWMMILDSDTMPEDLDIESIIDDTLEVKGFTYDNVNTHSSNVMAGANWEQGKTLDPATGGEITGSSTEYVSNFCGVYPNIQYATPATNGLAGNVKVFFYTLNHRIVDGTGFIRYDTVSGTNGTFDTPATARFIRMVYDTNSGTSAEELPSRAGATATTYDNAFITDEIEYKFLPLPATGSGKLKGLTALTKQFAQFSDTAYLEAYKAMKDAQDELKRLEMTLVTGLGDMYREGYWQKNDYVDGDEEKLYNDALENLEEIAFPETSYSVQYLDLYSANEDDVDFGVTDLSAGTLWPDLTQDYAVHLVDPEIGISKWAFIDKLSKCYDQPWKTTLTLNTKLSTIAQHSFTDVMTHIADVASEVKGKMTVYDRADIINSAGQLAAERLSGKIDANSLLITGGSSTWYTDENGNLMFISADGQSAMTLTGNGFAISNSKNEWGEWNWRTFGTGEGFTADEITAGFLSADRILAGSITTNHLAADVGQNLDLSTNYVLTEIKGATEDIQRRIQNAELKLADARIVSTVTQSDEYQSGVKTLMNQISQLAEQTEIRFKQVNEQSQEIENWFKFNNDATMEIGQNDSENFKMKLSNTELAFYQNQNKLAWFSNQAMNTTSVDILKNLKLGNFEFTVVDSGDGLVVN